MEALPALETQPATETPSHSRKIANKVDTPSHGVDTTSDTPTCPPSNEVSPSSSDHATGSVSPSVSAISMSRCFVSAPCVTLLPVTLPAPCGTGSVAAPVGESLQLHFSFNVTAVYSSNVFVRGARQSTPPTLDEQSVLHLDLLVDGDAYKQRVVVIVLPAAMFPCWPNDTTVEVTVAPLPALLNPAAVEAPLVVVSATTSVLSGAVASDQGVATALGLLPSFDFTKEGQRGWVYPRSNLRLSLKLLGLLGSILVFPPPLTPDQHYLKRIVHYHLKFFYLNSMLNSISCNSMSRCPF